MISWILANSEKTIPGIVVRPCFSCACKSFSFFQAADFTGSWYWAPGLQGVLIPRGPPGIRTHASNFQNGCELSSADCFFSSCQAPTNEGQMQGEAVRPYPASYLYRFRESIVFHKPGLLYLFVSNIDMGTAGRGNQY